MATRVASWGIGLLAFAAAAVLAWPGSPVPPNAPAATPKTATTAPEPARSTAATVAPAVERTVTAIAAATTDAGPRMMVEVQDAAGAPVAGADVRYAAWLDPPDDTLFDGWDRDRANWDRILQAAGQVHTDAGGRASWPWRALPRGGWLVAASHAGRWAERLLPAAPLASTVHLLQLQPDRTVWVQVVDANGRPVADQQVHVAAVVRGDNGDDFDDELAAVVSGADGSAQFVHAQQWLVRVRTEGGRLPFRVWTAIPGARAQVAADGAAATAIALALPPTGSVQVTLDDATGRPMSCGTPVSLRDPDQLATHRELTTPGLITFPHVALGCRFELTTLAPQVGFAGPTTAGEAIAVHVRCLPAVVVRGHLLHDGQPVANQRLWTSLTAVQWLDTDGHGAFAVLLRPDQIDHRLQRATFRLDRADAPPLQANWRGSLTLTAGEHDLGALAMTDDRTERPRTPGDQTLLVRGRLLGAAGDEDLSKVQLTLRDAHGFRVAWGWDGAVLERDHSDGSFEFRGPPPAEPFFLLVRSNQHLPMAPIPVTTGQRDVCIQLSHGSTVRAVFAVAREVGRGLHPRLVPLAATASDADDSGRMASATLVQDESTSFEWRRLAPGTYRVELLAVGCAQPVFARDVEVAAGVPCTEVAAPPLALPGLHAVRLRPRIPRPSAARAVVQFADGTVQRCAQDIDGTLFFVATTPVDVLVRAPGCRDQRLQGVMADRDVEFAPGIPVTIRCRIADLPEDAVLDLALRNDLWWRTGTGSSGTGPDDVCTAQFADGAWHTLVPAAGPYELWASGSEPSGRGFTMDFAPWQIDVGENGGEFDVRAQVIPDRR